MFTITYNGQTLELRSADLGDLEVIDPKLKTLIYEDGTFENKYTKRQKSRSYTFSELTKLQIDNLQIIATAAKGNKVTCHDGEESFTGYLPSKIQIQNEGPRYNVTLEITQCS